MYRFIIPFSAPIDRVIRLHRAANRRRGRTLVPVPLVATLGLRGRVERVERARVVALPWRERVVYTRRGWQWQPPAPPPAPTSDAAERAADDSRVRIVDVRSYLPDDPRVTPGIGYSTPRYGRVAVGYLDTSDLIEVDTGRRDTRKWVAPDGTTYIYDMGVTPGDPYTFYVYPPRTGGEEASNV